MSFDDKTIIEIGCGNGRLTLKFAHQARRVIGIDPSEKDIDLAILNTPTTVESILEFKVGVGEEIPSKDSEYDIVLFSSSLCCMESLENMYEALDEAWRVLKANGILINLQPSLNQNFKCGVVRYHITNNLEDLVFDDGWYKKTIEARFAVKYKTLIENRYNLVIDESYITNNYADRFEEVLNYYIGETNTDETNLSQEIYHKIKKNIESWNTHDGYQFLDHGVLTILRKKFQHET
ncbi:MAG: class I SAM-dependent methyltransferase [Candidatus Kariarchaeaceae archaeon]